jgi:hypothetical protein
MESKIHQVFNPTSTKWENDKSGYFKYDEAYRHYRFYEQSSDLSTFLVGPTEENLVNCPAVATGFVAYLIRNWGKKEVDIYEEYYELCFSEYEKRESRKPGAFKRNFKAEFYLHHLSNEEMLIAFSEKLFGFLPDGDIEIIKQFIVSYFDFLKPQNKSLLSEQYAEQWYGITHKILQAVNTEPQFINPNDKQKIMQFGVLKYNLDTTGRVFYNSWKDFDLLNVAREINSFPKKNRHNWKDIILTIAKNRNEVALWLKNQNK